MRIKSEFHIIFLLICFPILSAHAQIRRCANPNPPYTVKENRSFKKAATTTISVPVIFHVIYDNSGNGNVQESKLQAQVDTLNATHSRSGSQYRFYLAAITRTNNTNWWDINFYSRPDSPTYDIPSQTEMDMTNALAIDPTHAFNIYVSRLTSSYGWVIYFPWKVSEDSKQNGIIIDYRTLPGGEYSYYNYGYITVHEGGHYLGLYHTFQNACTPPGDEVDDTPYQDTTNVDICNDLLDTCPSAGKDPVHNYMNYTDDRCIDNFTAGQMGRIASITGQYKPNLGGTTLVFTSTYIVANSSLLKIFSGTTLQFTSGSSLIINGTLTANGTSTSLILFNFTSPNSTTQNGIVLGSSSSGTINYCQIRNAYRGIYENNKTVDITNSSISSCTYGIYLYNSNPSISNSTISGCTEGIYLSSSIADISYSTISNCGGDGIYQSSSNGNINSSSISGCTNGIYLYSSSPSIGSCNIYSNSNGIYVYNSHPGIGSCNIYNNSDGINMLNSLSSSIEGNSIHDNYSCHICPKR